MYYRTFYTRNNFTQLSITDLYNGITVPIQESDTVKTVTVQTLPPSWLENKQRLNDTLIKLFEDNKHITISYTEYNIPKHSGGYRLISAPSDELKELQKKLADILLTYGAHAHDAAFSYVKNRTCKAALQRHQNKHTEWFYKFDLKNFFPSCTVNLLQQQLSIVFPFCLLDEDVLNKLIQYATFKGALPQGSPLSPLLSNMIMVPFDWAMYYSIRHFDGVYTRYADDIQISFPFRKQLSFIEHIIQGHLPEGLVINSEKSRCGSTKGHNFNLGLVLNKDNNITIGYKKKMELKAKLNNFIFDFTNQRYWSIIETQVLQGELNYFKQIEPEYANFAIKRLERKHNVPSISSMFADIIAGRV